MQRLIGMSYGVSGPMSNQEERDAIALKIAESLRDNDSYYFPPGVVYSMDQINELIVRGEELLEQQKEIKPSGFEATAKLPPLPDGWVYDGFRHVKCNEMLFDGSSWIVSRFDIDCLFFVAVKKPAPWKPLPELVSALLLVFGPGWIFRRCPSSCGFTYQKPEYSKFGWKIFTDYHDLPETLIPCRIPFNESIFKIGEPKQ